MNESALGAAFRALVNSRPVQETGAEMRRLGVQGSMEVANALFSGHAFTPYGPGQWPSAEREGARQQQQRGMHM